MQIIPFPDRAAWPALLARPVQSSEQIEKAVAPILAQVRAQGDQALFDLAQRFDNIDLSAGGLEVPVADLEAAEDRVER